MTFDREEQRKIFLELINNSQFQGRTIKKIYQLVCEIEEAICMENLSVEKDSNIEGTQPK